MTIGILIVLWCLIGISGMLYWISKDNDITLDIFLVSIIFGSLIGPTAWLIGWLFYGKGADHLESLCNWLQNTTIIKKRK